MRLFHDISTSRCNIRFWNLHSWELINTCPKSGWTRWSLLYLAWPVGKPTKTQCKSGSARIAYLYWSSHKSLILQWVPPVGSINSSRTSSLGYNRYAVRVKSSWKQGLATLPASINHCGRSTVHTFVQSYKDVVLGRPARPLRETQAIDTWYTSKI